MAWPAPQVVFFEVPLEIAGIAARRADVDHLADSRKPRGLHHVRAHHQVAVVEFGRLGLVDTDPPVVCGRVEDHVARVLEQAAQAGIERHEVVIALPGHEDLCSETLQPLDQVLAEETGPTSYRDMLVRPETSHVGAPGIVASGEWSVNGRWQMADGKRLPGLHSPLATIPS